MARDIFDYRLRGYPEEAKIPRVKPLREKSSQRFIKVFDMMIDELSPKAVKLLIVLSRRLSEVNELGTRLYPAKIEKVAGIDYKTARALYSELVGANAIKDYLGSTYINPNMITRAADVPDYVYSVFEKEYDNE